MIIRLLRFYAGAELLGAVIICLKIGDENVYFSGPICLFIMLVSGLAALLLFAQAEKLELLHIIAKGENQKKQILKQEGLTQEQRTFIQISKKLKK